MNVCGVRAFKQKKKNKVLHLYACEETPKKHEKFKYSQINECFQTIR